MNLQRLMRRNRFKNKPKTPKAAWQWPAFVLRVAHVRAPRRAAAAD